MFLSDIAKSKYFWRLFLIAKSFILFSMHFTFAENTKMRKQYQNNLFP